MSESALIKKKTKFSSYIRKPEGSGCKVSSYMTKDLRISSYIMKPFLIYDFEPLPSEFPLIWGKFLIFFISVHGSAYFMFNSLILGRQTKQVVR